MKMAVPKINGLVRLHGAYFCSRFGGEGQVVVEGSVTVSLPLAHPPRTRLQDSIKVWIPNGAHPFKVCNELMISSTF